MNIYEKLSKIQMELKAPKNQYNNFGGYKYRSCEDILEAVKPLLEKYNCVLKLDDKLEQVGERYYVRAIAWLYNAEVESEKRNDEFIYNTAYAREEESKKGMDGSQITGASSSYARKYALNGLFLIDDVKDSDSTNTHETEEKKATEKQIKMINDLGLDLEKVCDYYQVNYLNELTISQASEIIKAKTKGE